MKLYLVCGLFCIGSVAASMSSEWTYAHAITAAQDGNWNEAQRRMSALLVDDPDNAELLYDSGVVAYRMHEYEKAAAYFHQAAHEEQAPDRIKEQSFFNLGNTQVTLKQLKEAIASYEAALAIDPDDVYARHNLEVVRKQLEQQEQQQEQNQQNNQDEQSQQNQEQNENGSDQDQKQEGSSAKDQQGGGSDTSNNRDEQTNEGNGDQQSSREQEQGNGADEQQERDRKDDAGKQLDRDQRKQDQEQRGNSHDSSPQKDSQNGQRTDMNRAPHDMKQADESQEIQAGSLDEQEITDVRAQQLKVVEQELAPEDRWMVRVLQQRDRADEQANKQMVKAMIDKELAGKDGQNCW